jgi:bacteriocin biosynthesis cyclodehydratase domain-containing protein
MSPPERLRSRNLRFPARPRLLADLDVFSMPDGLGLQVRGGEVDVVLRGRVADALVPWLLPRLDGRHAWQDLVADRPGEAGAEEVADVLLLLLRKGLLTDGVEPRAPRAPDPTEQRQLLFWGRKLGVTRINTSARQVQQKLARARVVLLAGGLFGCTTLDLLLRSGCEDLALLDWGDGQVAETLRALGAERAEEVAAALRGDAGAAVEALEPLLATADLLLTATRNAPDALFEALNAAVLRRGTPWLRGDETPSAFEIGPFLNGLDTPCFTCMRLRARGVEEMPVEEKLYQEHLAGPGPEGLQGESLAHSAVGAGLLVSEALRALTGVAPVLTEGAVLTQELDGPSSLDRFRRVPRCPDCYPGDAVTHPD